MDKPINLRLEVEQALSRLMFSHARRQWEDFAALVRDIGKEEHSPSVKACLQDLEVRAEANAKYWQEQAESLPRGEQT